MFFNADWRVFTFDEEDIKKSEMKGENKFTLKELEETEKNGGGMGRSDAGWFGIVDGDFPPEIEDALRDEQSKHPYKSYE